MKDKILNLLIVLLLTFLVFNILQKNEKPAPQGGGNITFSTSANSYSIPVSAALTIDNQFGTGVVINTCKDITVSQNGTFIVLPKTFCSSLSIPASSKKVISLSPYFSLLSQTGNYVFELHHDGKKYVTTFEVQTQGTIAKVFTYLFYAPIYNAMIFLIEFFGFSLGCAIIAITIIIRLLLLRPQHKMLVSQQKLQKIQPKIKHLQEQHKGDAQVLGLELMTLYSSEKVNPMGSCGFLIIQMPILLVIYRIIASISDPVNTYYLYNYFQGFSIDQIGSIFLGIDLLKSGGMTGIFLGIAVGLVQFIQVKLSLALNPHKKELAKIEKTPAELQGFMPDQESLNKFMLYGMPVMVGFFTYSLFAGVGIYWGISTTFGIFQQLFVNKLLKK